MSYFDKNDLAEEHVDGGSSFFSPEDIAEDAEIQPVAKLDASPDALRKRLRLKDSLLNKLGYVKNRTKDDTPDEEGLTLDDYGKFVQSTDFNALDDERLADLAKQIDTKHATVAKKDTSGFSGVARNTWRKAKKGYTDRLGKSQLMLATDIGSRLKGESPSDETMKNIQQGQNEYNDALPTFDGGVQDIRGVSDAVNYVSGSAVENAVGMLPNALLGIAGGIVGGHSGQKVGSFIGSYGQNYAEAVTDQIDEGKDKINYGLAHAQAIGYSIVDAAFGAGSQVAKRFLKKSTLDVAKKSFVKNMWDVAKTANKAGLGEAGAEVTQDEVIKRGRRAVQGGTLDSAFTDDETPKSIALGIANTALQSYFAGFAFGGAEASMELPGNKKLMAKADKFLGKATQDKDLNELDGYDKVLTYNVLMNSSVRGDIESQLEDVAGTRKQMISAFSRSERAKKMSKSKRQEYVDSYLSEDSISTRLNKTLSDMSKYDAEARNTIGGKAKTVLNAWESEFTDASFDNIPDTVKPTFDVKKAYDSKIEEADGSKTYFDETSGIMIQGREGAWNVFNRNGMKMPISEDGSVDTIQDAVGFAQNLSRMNQWRIENNQSKSEFIKRVAEKEHPGANVIQVDSAKQIKDEGARSRMLGGEQAFYSPKDNTIYVMLDAIKNPAQAAIVLAHEDTHRGLMDVLKKGGLIEEGETVNEAKQRLFGADNSRDAEKSEEQIARTGEQWQGNRGKLAKMRDTMQSWLYQKTGTRTVIGNADVRIWLDTIEQASKTAEGGKVEYQPEGQSDANKLRYQDSFYGQGTLEEQAQRQNDAAPDEKVSQERVINRDTKRAGLVAGMNQPVEPSVVVEKTSDVPSVQADTAPSEKALPTSTVRSFVKTELRTDRIKENHADLFQQALDVTDNDEQAAAGLVSEWLAGQNIADKSVPDSVRVASKLEQKSDLTAKDADTLEQNAVFGKDLFLFGYRKDKQTGSWKYEAPVQPEKPVEKVKANSRYWRESLVEGMHQRSIPDEIITPIEKEPARAPFVDNKEEFSKPKQSGDGEAVVRGIAREDRLQRRMDALSEQTKNLPKWTPIKKTPPTDGGLSTRLVTRRQVSERISGLIKNRWNDMSVDERRTMVELKSNRPQGVASVDLMDMLDLFEMDLDTRPSQGSQQPTQEPPQSTPVEPVPSTPVVEQKPAETAQEPIPAKSKSSVKASKAKEVDEKAPESEGKEKAPEEFSTKPQAALSEPDAMTELKKKFLAIGNNAERARSAVTPEKRSAIDAEWKEFYRKETEPKLDRKGRTTEQVKSLRKMSQAVKDAMADGGSMLPGIDAPAVKESLTTEKATPNVASATPNVSLKRGTKIATTRNADGVSYFGEVLQSNPDGTVKIRAFKEKTKGTIGAKGYGVDSKGNQVTKDIDVPAESVKSVDATADTSKLTNEERRKLKMAEAVDAANADNELRKGSVEATKDLVDSFNSAKERKEQRKTDNGDVMFRRSGANVSYAKDIISTDNGDMKVGALLRKIANAPDTKKDAMFLSTYGDDRAKLVDEMVLTLPNGTYLLNRTGRASPAITDVIEQKYGTMAGTSVSDKTIMGLSARHPESVQASLTLGLDEVRLSNYNDVNTTDNGDVMFRRVTPEQDAAYLDAVQKGDMETAGRIVDEAAKKAERLTLWTGQRHSGTVLQRSTGVWLSEDERIAKGYAGKNGLLRKVYVFADDVVPFDELLPALQQVIGQRMEEWTDDDVSAYSEYASVYDMDTGREAMDEAAPYALQRNPDQTDIDRFMFLAPEALRELGYNPDTSIVAREYEVGGGMKDGTMEYVSFSPSQIKSADAATYDDSGNVIPLSQRFNDESSDIRFRRASSSAASTRKALRNMSLASSYVRAYPSDSPDGRRAQATVELAYEDSLTPKTLQEMGDEGKRSYDADPQAAELALLAGTTPSGKVDEDAKRMARDKVAVNVMTERAIASGDAKQASTAMLAVWRWYERGTEVARALRMRFDPQDTPEGRKQFVMRSLLAPTDTDIIRAKRAKDTKAQMEAMKPSAVKALATLKKLRSIMVADKATGKKHSLDFTAFTNEQLMDEALMNQVLVEIATERAGWGDKIHEFWRNSILSGVPTQVVNTLGNAGNAALEAFVQRPVQAIVNSFVGNPDAATKASVLAMWKAMSPSYKKANANFIKAWVSENSVTGPRSSKLDDANSAIQGRKGKIIRMPQRLMTATDEWFKTIFMSMLTADYATRKFDVMLKDGKVKESERDAFLSESMQVGTDAYAKAWEDALKWSFQQKNGVIAQGISRWRSDPNLGFIMKFILPFVKTPANIVSTGMRKSPFGIPNAAYRLVQAARGNGDVNQAIELGAEQLVGMIVMASIWGLTQGDDDDELNRPRLTGSKKAGGKYRPGMRESEMRDYPPTSIRIGDKWISYARLEPFATVLSTMADVMTAWEQGKDGRYGDIPMTAFNSLKANFRDKTFLSGIGDIIEIMEDGDEKKLVMSLQKIASGFMPNIVRTTVRAFDPYIRDYRNREEGKEWGKTFGKRFVQASLPAKEIAPVPRYDIKGKPVEREGGGIYNAISPFRVQSADRITKVDAMLKRYNDAQKDDNDRWMPSVPAMPKVKMLGKKDYIKLTDEEYAEYQQIAGKFADTRLGRMRFNLANPSERDVDRVKAVYKESREYAKNRIRAKIISRYRRELVK